MDIAIRIAALLGAVLLSGVLWLVYEFTHAPEGEEIPGVGFVPKVRK